MLRPAHLAYYKTSAEYQLLKILDLSEIHSCTAISLKKHANTFGLVSPVRTFYLQASTQGEVQEWVKAIQDARETLMATSTVNSVPTPPIPIPGAHPRSGSHQAAPATPSPASHPSFMQNVTSSDSEDGSPSAARTYPTSSQMRAGIASSPSKVLHTPGKESSKIMISGYLMKCGQKRNNWRKRWFVLDGEKLVYSGSHMVSRSIHDISLLRLIIDCVCYCSHYRIQSHIASSSSLRSWTPWNMTYQRIGKSPLPLLLHQHLFPPPCPMTETCCAILTRSKSSRPSARSYYAHPARRKKSSG